MCKLQEPPFEMDIPKPKEKKTKKAKKTTGVEVVQAVQEASEPQMIVNENAQPAFELSSWFPYSKHETGWRFLRYTSQ